MGKLRLAILLLLMGSCLVACKSEETRIVVENEVTYDYIGIMSIEVNEETFTTICKKDKDGEGYAVLGGTRTYTDDSGKEYRAEYSDSCVVIYDNTLYHGFDLIEKGLLTVEELELVEFPFSEVVD
jgi:hypothetical protein